MARQFALDREGDLGYLKVMEAHQQIGEYLNTFFKGKYQWEAEEKSYFVTYGSTLIRISVLPFGNHQLVEFMAYVAQGVDPTEELMRHLLFLNYKIPIGAFSLVDEDVFYSHAILLDTLTKDEFLTSLAVVARVADDEDDFIVLTYGGNRAIDQVARPSRSRL